MIFNQAILQNGIFVPKRAVEEKKTNEVTRRIKTGNIRVFNSNILAFNICFKTI